MSFERVAVVGGGAWGSALAQAAAMAGRDVVLIARDPEAVVEINEHHTNTRHLGAQFAVRADRCQPPL
jgi:glycerol-3-phosphate dehydrogenase (NAD(P)+)